MAASMLRVAIVQADCSQRELAARVGLHETTLSRLVRGHACASVGTRMALANHLRTPVDSLFGPDGRPLPAR